MAARRTRAASGGRPAQRRARRDPGRAKKTTARSRAKKTTARGRAKKTARGRAKKQAQRLDPGVRPGNVDVHVEVDPSRSPRYRGQVSIELELATSRSALVLNAADLQVGQARVESAGRTQRGAVVVTNRSQDAGSFASVRAGL